MFLSLVFACTAPESDPKDDADTGDTADTDTADTDTADTDTADTDTADTDTDTGSNGRSADVTFVFDEDASGRTLALYRFDALGGDGVAEASTAFGVTGLSQTVTLDGPPAEDLTVIDGYPNTSAAFYAPVLFGDDGNLTLDDGEVVAGASTVYLAYIEGELPSELAIYGIVLGWNALDLTTGTAPDPHPLNAVPVPANLLPAPATMSGAGDGLSRVALVPGQFFDGEALPAELVFDESWDADFSASFVDAPGADHLTDFDDGLRAALEVPTLYLDSDVSGGFSAADTVVGTLCVSSGRGIGALWLPDVTTADVAVYWAQNRFRAGWNTIVVVDDGTEDGSAVVVSGEGLTTCAD